jgi:hypothetical protein
MEESEELLIKWSFNRFENGIAHFEDIFEKITLLAKEKNTNAQTIRTFLEDLSSCMKKANKKLKTMSNNFKEKMTLELTDENLERNFEGLYQFIEDKIHKSKSEGWQMDEVLSKLNITQIYTSKNLKKNIDDMMRSLQGIKEVYSRYKNSYRLYIQICSTAQQEYYSKTKKVSSNSNSFQRIMEKLDHQKSLTKKRNLTKVLNSYRFDIGRNEIEKMMKYFKRGDRKILKDNSLKGEVEHELQERWLEMAVKIKVNLRVKLDQLQENKQDAGQKFKSLVENESIKIKKKFKIMNNAFEDYFQQMEQILRKCLEIERNWKRRVVFAVTDVFGHKSSEDFKMKFLNILNVNIFSKFEY